MNHSEVIQYTSTFNIDSAHMQRLLPIGAMLIGAHVNAYSTGLTVHFMACRRRDVERIPLPTAEATDAGDRPMGFFRYVFRIAKVGVELPPNINWCPPVKIEDSRFVGRDTKYLFYAIEP